jgi:type IV pilus assembly protein PilY1
MLSHRNCKSWFAAALPLLVGLTALAVPTTASAQVECEIPLFIKQTSGDANVMILADNSFSMNSIVLHQEFDKDVLWVGEFEPDATYFVAQDDVYAPVDFNRRWPLSPSVALANSDNGEDGRYTGNYLNWLYFHATDEQRATVPLGTRIQVLKAVLTDIVDRSAQLRMGVCVFQKNDTGGNLIGQIPKSHSALRAIIAGITANALTPSGESLETILDYFGDRTQSPIESECQYNFVIMVTDGYPTVDEGVSPYLWDADGDGNDPGDCVSIGAPYPNNMGCSDHMDDVAWWMANEDVHPTMDGEQNVFTYTIGYEFTAPLLRETAENGNGLYFEAKNAAELTVAIEHALQDILRRISSGSAVAVVSTEQGTDDRLYRGKFMPVDWDGFFECFALPHNEDDLPIWEAGEFLRTRNPDSRKIFTAIGNNTLNFVPGNAAPLQAKMGVATENLAAELITWGRGENVPGLRDRQGWVLGDIIHSTPVVVGPPSQFVMEESYEIFRQANEHRTKMVYVGANDGMVHGFDAETGNEKWAFVPEFALPTFEAMADSFYCHSYSCDQTVSIRDVKISGNWKTVMAAGGGEGGSSIFALDITNPDSPHMLWQADLPNGMKDHSEVEICSIGGMPVALVGSGFDITNMEAWLYAYNMNNGQLLGSLLLSRDNGALRNRASRPAVVDVNLDGQADLVYITDMLGTVYRIALGNNGNPGGWDISRLYVGEEEITADPVAAYGPNGAIYVYFGTGAYIEDPDMESVGQNSFLCVFDHHDGSTASKGSMADQTSSVGEISGHSGWYVDLWNDDAERVTQKCVVVAETVIFTSFAPSDDPCVAGGNSWLYQMSYEDGGIPDVDGMEVEEDRSVSIGEGIASHPVIDLAAGEAIVQSSDASINVERIAAIITPLRVRSWQENYDHVENPDQEVVTGDK